MADLALRQASIDRLVEPACGRQEIIARYRRLRTITRAHHNRCLEFIASDALLRHGRRLGLARGKTFLVDNPDEMNFVFDLAIHTAEPGRMRAIDRYAGAAKLEPGSDETLALSAMQDSRFTIVRVERRHPDAGLVVSDPFFGVDVWLIDESLETSAPDGFTFLTRLYAFDAFCMMAGVVVPLEPETWVAATETIPFLADRPLSEAIVDRRFAEAIYRAAIMAGTTARVRYRDVTAARA